MQNLLGIKIYPILMDLGMNEVWFTKGMDFEKNPFLDLNLILMKMNE
jgi:hypothetical protein